MLCFVPNPVAILHVPNASSTHPTVPSPPQTMILTLGTSRNICSPEVGPPLLRLYTCHENTRLLIVIAPDGLILGQHVRCEDNHIYASLITWRGLSRYWNLRRIFAPCRPPDLGLTKTSKGSVPSAGFIWKDPGPP